MIRNIGPVCPKSLDPFHIATQYIIWVKTSWRCSIPPWLHEVACALTKVTDKLFFLAVLRIQRPKKIQFGAAIPIYRDIFYFLIDRIWRFKRSGFKTLKNEYFVKDHLINFWGLQLNFVLLKLPKIWKEILPQILDTRDQIYWFIAWCCMCLMKVTVN